MKDKFTILFVCEGNTCRSPMAVGILDSLIPEKLRDRTEILSAGISVPFKSKVSPEAVSVASESGMDISDHVPKSVTSDILQRSDIILTFSISQKEYLKGVGVSTEKLFVLGEFGPENSLFQTIEDPAGGTIEVYRECYYEIESEMKRILPMLVEIIEERYG